VNWEKLKKNVGWRVQLAPQAIHLDALGHELPVRNEDWIIQQVTDTNLRLDESVVMGLTTRIAKDSIHEFSHNAQRSVPGGIQYGFLTLKLQMTIQNDIITYRPCRPGERVPPPPPPLTEDMVEFNYPTTSGLQMRLEAAGCRVHCSADRHVRTRELEGWEIVREPDSRGVLHSFRCSGRDGDLILMKLRGGR
jgi:hypothetical protein